MKRRILWSLVISAVLILALVLGINAQETGDSAEPDGVFEFKGYSLSPFGTDICLGFDVDYEAKEAYEAQLGRAVDIGVVFAASENLNGQTPLDENGNPRVLQKGKVVVFPLNGYSYQNYDLKVTDFSQDFYSHKVIVAPYLYDGSQVYYYQENGADASVEGVSYEEILDMVNEHMFANVIADEYLRSAASCNGNATYYKSCPECGEISAEWFEVENTKLEHNLVISEGTPATCTEPGLSRGSYCTICNTVFETQETIPATGHNYQVVSSKSSAPTLSSAGTKVTTCAGCSDTKTETVDKLVATKVTKDRIYDITTGEYNPALANAWNVVDGNLITSNLWAAGNDWFGNVGDVLTITLDQEMYLSSLYMYVGGNYTFAKVTVKNANGQVTASTSVGANDGAYGGTGAKTTVFSGKNILAYTVEIQITSLKWDSPMTFKVAEVEIHAADIDLSFDHTHVYRDFVEQTVAPTCHSQGKETYACYCGGTTEVPVPVVDHTFDTLLYVEESTCTQNGKEIYECYCGATNEVVTYAKGHVYERFVSYTNEPTISANGTALYQCIGCELREERVAPMLPLEELKYLRVAEINGTTVTLKFNITSSPVNYDVRYSTAEITSSNFQNASAIEASITGEREMTVTITLDAGIDKCYYVAIKPYIGDNVGEVYSIRVGGDKLIPVDYDDSRVYHGETLSSFKKLFDEQGFKDSGATPSSILSRIFTDTSDTLLYGMSMRPIVDLEYMHYVSNVYTYFASSGKTIKVRWSKTPVDFMAEDSAWDGSYEFTAQTGWNTINVAQDARYIQIIFEDGYAPAEMVIYGYQNGEGDKITMEDYENVTIGEMMGMCGFVAGGGGNTPIDSVICSTVLREYHNFGWSYDLNAYMSRPTKLEGSWMCNFDTQYKNYSAAGINVIPCIQWNLVNVQVSNKVDENNQPVVEDSAFVRADFFDRFNPHTYFMYADSMFALAARYGANNSPSLKEIADQRVIDKTQVVGLNCIKWLELGNEPDGSWNGVHNYYSAYQYAALLSAGYDGHCSTLTSSVLDGINHFGVKNADPTMGVAMAGISAADCNYINAMSYWMKANRKDGKVAYDAFNVHHYMTKQIQINGNNFTVGASPEEGKLKETMAKFVELRNKYYSGKEVWITEFGWDTNQAYATATSAHAYGNYTGRQVQAMWLTRSYLLLSSCGVDKATMYMCEDAGVESESVGKYGTCGVIAYEYDENGKTVEVKKDSYYYMYTLKNTLGDFKFKREVAAYDENVLIYEYESNDGRTAYAVWCKTSDGTTSENYLLKVDAEKATLVEAVYGDIDGVKSELTSDSIGYVSINVSENPVYVIVD
ncbi:MAG: hypothetical protein E7596_04375 [Ruminococcaceae bacterium]|nr:hypothetical protein [Oscillospiraceae bacterium]